MFKLRPAQKPAQNLADEFWEQLRTIPHSAKAEGVTHASWMLHHPLDVALDYTRRYLPHVMDAEDQLLAFVNFWVPSNTRRRNVLLGKLREQSCWERTSWIPFTKKVRVLPYRYAHHAFLFTALVALETHRNYARVSGRYTNAELHAGSSYCKNNCMPPVVEGRWQESEEQALRALIASDHGALAGVNCTVRLLRSMILTLLSSSGHTSFVVGFPRVADGVLRFDSLAHAADAAKAKYNVMHVADSTYIPTLHMQKFGRLKRPEPISQPATKSSASSPAPQQIPSGRSRAADVVDDILVCAAISSALSQDVPAAQCAPSYEPAAPSYSRDDSSPSSSDSGASYCE